MKTIILCGGRGTRLKEETEFKPKPMVLIGNRPIIWHIMKIYAYYGYNEFVLALGYKGDMIKDYFLNNKTFSNDFKLDTATNEIIFFDNKSDNFKITFADTGLESLTGERILRSKKYIEDDEFMVTYGDGVADINIKKLVDFHREQRTKGTITGVRPYSKYGLVRMDKEEKLVEGFDQKPLLYDYASGGFMIFNREVFDYLDNGPMENAFFKLVKEKQLSVYKHDGFWRGMDTFLEMEELNKLWSVEKPWAVWEKDNEKFNL